MATKWTSPVWRMPEESNQSKLDNYSLDFSGTGNYIDLTPEVQFGPNSTISIWYKKDVANSIQKLIGGTNNYGYTLYVVDYKLYMWFGTTNNQYLTGPTSGANTLRTTDWVHLAIVRFGTNDPGDSVKLYVNGTNMATFTDTIGAHTTLSKVNRFGAGNDGTNEFAGKMSQCALFDYSLSETQVKYLYNNNAGGSTPNPQNPMAIAGPTPIAYYPLGGSSTGSSSTLTIPNESDNGDTVFDFNRSDSDYISLDPGVMKNFTSDNVSISAWVKADAFNAYDYIFVDGHTSGNKMVALNYANARGGLEFTVGNGSLARASGVSINTGRWYHIVCTYAAGGDLKFYLDGNTTPVATATFSSALDLSSHTKSSIGRSNVHSTNYWDGEISNVQVWNSVLGTSDVTTLYNGGRPYTGTQPQAANLKGWWKMNVDNSSYVDTITDWLIPSSANPTPLAISCYRFRNNGGGKFGNSSSIGKSSETSFTMSYWLNKLDNSDRYPMGINGSFYSDNGYIRVRMTSSSILLYHNKNASSGGSAVISIANAGISYKRWHHYLWTYSSSSWKLFIDGVDKTSNLTNTNIPDTMPVGGSSPNAIGSYWAPPTNNTGNASDLNGFMSNVALWNSDKSSNYLDIYNSGTPGDISSLSPNNWWKLETDTLDSGSSGNDLITNGLTWVSAQKTNNLAVTTGAMGESSGMTTANLVTSDLNRSLLYSSYSMDFDAASSDYIDLGGDSSLFPTSQLTASIWVKASTQPNFRYVMAAPNDTSYPAYGFSTRTVGSTQGLQFVLNTGSAIISPLADVLDNNWHHIASTYDGSSLKMFVDGSEVGTGTSTSGNIIYGAGAGAGAGKLLLGDFGLFSLFFDGLLSNASIFDKALSENEILTIYNGGAPNDISSLSPVGWWSLSGDSYFATNWICPDLSANSNNGTSNGIPVTALVGNAPGSTSNGTGTSMAIPTNLQGDAPNSDKNAISINMVATNRVSGSGNVP